MAAHRLGEAGEGAELRERELAAVASYNTALDELEKRVAKDRGGGGDAAKEKKSRE